MTTLVLPVRVSTNGTVTHPMISPDPYLAHWVEGAEGTLPLGTRRKYPEGPADLREKVAVLKLKRRPYVERGDGPQLRSAAFRALADRVPSSDGNPFSWDA